MHNLAGYFFIVVAGVKRRKATKALGIIHFRIGSSAKPYML